LIRRFHNLLSFQVTPVFEIEYLPASGVMTQRKYLFADNKIYIFRQKRQLIKNIAETAIYQIKKG